MQLLPPRMRLCFVIPEPISAHLISTPGTGKCQCYYLLSLSVSAESSDSAKGANEAQLSAETFIVLCCSGQNPSIYFPSVGAGSQCIHLHELIIHLIISMPSQWGMKAINKSQHCCRLLNDQGRVLAVTVAVTTSTRALCKVSLRAEEHMLCFRSGHESVSLLPLMSLG